MLSCGPSALHSGLWWKNHQKSNGKARAKCTSLIVFPRFDHFLAGRTYAARRVPSASSRRSVGSLRSAPRRRTALVRGRGRRWSRKGAGRRAKGGRSSSVNPTLRDSHTERGSAEPLAPNPSPPNPSSSCRWRRRDSLTLGVHTEAAERVRAPFRNSLLPSSTPPSLCLRTEGSSQAPGVAAAAAALLKSRLRR